MPTPLGGAGFGAIVMTVRSAEASNTIKRGHVVAVSVAASNPTANFINSWTENRDYGTGTNRQLDGLPVINVTRGAVDTNTIGNGFNIGIANEDILPGTTGQITVYGLAQVIANGAITVGEVISSAAAGKVLDAASATHANPFGVMMEAVSAGDATGDVPRWALVNFLNSFSNTANGAAYAQMVKFMGKAY